MDIKQIKKRLKEKGMTYEDLSNVTKLSISTIKKILSGSARFPRVDTIELIEKALGINQEPKVTSEQSELFELINSMNEEELAELTQIVDYVISKRK